MKLKLQTMEDFDSLQTAIDTDTIEQPKRRWRNLLGTLSRPFRKLLSIVKNLGVNELPSSLGRLTLRAYLEACQAQKPSELVRIIADDLELELTNINQSVSCWKLWTKQLQDIGKKLEKAQPNINGDAMSTAIWQQVSEKHKLPSHIWLVDSMAKRFNISYEQAYQLKMFDVIIANTIDGCNAEYEHRIADMHKQQRLGR